MQVFVFPGQGSQKRGMGQTLFDEVAQFGNAERDIDALLGYSLRELCLQDSQNRLAQTEYTQPSLYVVNALHYYKAIGEGLRPDFLAGHSLGEYNALLAAGAFDFITGLRLVKKRGELMTQARNGGMAAIVGLTPDRISALLKENALSGLDVANYNAPMQTVISGPKGEIDSAKPIIEKAGARLYKPLAVSAAFHSRYMQEAGSVFDSFLASFTFKDLLVPVIANVTGQPYPAGDPTNHVRSLLVRQISHPVRWTQSVSYLIEAGATSFKELGPGVVLTKLIQQIQQPS